MSAVLADTHTIVWYLDPPGKLTAAATSALDGATQAGAPIYVASISVIEVLYLVDKGRLQPLALSRLLHALADMHSGLVPVTLDLAIVREVQNIAYAAVPEMPDRIIAATALYMGVPLVTRDLRIQASGITTIW